MKFQQDLNSTISIKMVDVEPKAIGKAFVLRCLEKMEKIKKDHMCLTLYSKFYEYQLKAIIIAQVLYN